MITFQDVSFSYPGTPPVSVLQHCSFSIASGESVALIGPSGSGKTSALLLLAALEQPSQGTILLDGSRLDTRSADVLADWRRDEVGIVFQSFHLLPGLTALANVSLPLEIAGKPGARSKAAEMLAKVGLAHRQSHYPAALSGGEQQRVAIARALVHRPRLLLGDEPTGNLDEETGNRILDLLFSLREEIGTTLVLVTHDAHVAKRCQRVLRLHQGRMVAD